MKTLKVSLIRKRLILAGGLLLTLWASWHVSKEPPKPKFVAERVVKRLPSKSPAPALVFSLEWPLREDTHPPIADVFNPPAPSIATVVPMPQALPVPIFNYQYIGHLNNGANSFAFLTDAQNRVISVKPGEPVDDHWQFITISSTQLVFRHTSTKIEHTMQIGSLQ